MVTVIVLVLAMVILHGHGHDRGHALVLDHGDGQDFCVSQRSHHVDEATAHIRLRLIKSVVHVD